MSKVIGKELVQVVMMSVTEVDDDGVETTKLKPAFGCFWDNKEFYFDNYTMKLENGEVKKGICCKLKKSVFDSLK